MSFKGLDSFFEVLAIIKDPAKYEDLVTRLANETKQYTEAVEAVVAVSEVSDYTCNIRENDMKAKQALTDATQQAFVIVQEAKESAKAIKDKAKILQTKAEEFAQSLSEKEKLLEDQQAELVNREKGLAQQTEYIQYQMEANKKLHDELQARTAKLLEAIG